MIEARGLTKSYQIYAKPHDRLKQMVLGHRRRFGTELRALRSLDLSVYPGETVGVVGRNGSGKSTLLRLVCGTLSPTSGSLVVRGRVAPILTIGAGFNPRFTGLENVLLNASILGLRDGDIARKLGAIAEFADIGRFFELPVRFYSTGMYSRLAFAVAIHTDPDVLVIDETLAVGDEAFARKCFARIDEIKSRGTTILFVSHSARHVVELADRALLLEGGERILIGSPKTVMSAYHRILYTTSSDRWRVIEQLRSRDNERGPWTEERQEPDAPVPPRHGALERPRSDPRPEHFGRFDPNLSSRSRHEYLERGARIENPRILTPDGHTVNVLLPDQEYCYAFEVDFTTAAFGVRFGTMIKTTTGVELAGQVSHPRGRGIDVVSGHRAQVRFPFRPRLAAGTYFLNAGVVDADHVFLHRVVDAFVFRIEARAESRVTGLVDLSRPRGPQVTIERYLAEEPNSAQPGRRTDRDPPPSNTAARSLDSN